MKKPKSLYTFLRPILRNASLRWPARNECLKLARVARGLYKCNMCKEEFPRSSVHVDHIDPVISIKENFTTWDDFINRLFCNVEQFQLLCESCHLIKTQIENEMRKHYKKLAKQNKKG